MVRGAREIRAAFHGYDRFGFYRQTKTSPQSGLTRLIVLDDREEFGAGTRLEVDGAHPSNRSASAKTSVAWIGSHKPFLYSRYLRSTSSTHASSISSRTSPPNELGKRSARKARSCRGRFNAYLVLLFQARQTLFVVLDYQSILSWNLSGNRGSAHTLNVFFPVHLRWPSIAITRTKRIFALRSPVRQPR
uniref:Uncharacterized protein n=1 Tax=Candidatus Kentrum sp. LFY TaxID=2126342 RepID=A0A450VCS7_9GAMM|nr:MAG: hypothetical protein BECKLFY1418A_GA0070994_12111 [Candidatus Kentron sp. LFY]